MRNGTPKLKTEAITLLVEQRVKAVAETAVKNSSPESDEFHQDLGVVVSQPELIPTIVTKRGRSVPKVKSQRRKGFLPTERDQDSEPTEIRFYRSNETPYGAFSNLYRRAIVFEGIEYPTAEHAYQAGKARKKAVRDWILSAPSASLVAMAAHGLYTWDIVPNWSITKFSRMKGVLIAKFSQHKDLKELLLGTGSARLIESATVDNAVNRLWGEVNGVGRNMLGTLLMEVRDELRGSQR